MRNRSARLWIVAVLCACCFDVYAWGPAAHAYVAKKVVGGPWLGAMYGAMLPDMFDLASTHDIKSKTQRLTHFEYYRLSAATPFAVGFATHNGDWGADHYSHGYYNPSQPDTYLTTRMKQFAAEFGRTVNDGETVMEAVVDYMIRKDLGPEWGSLLAKSVDAAGAPEEQAIADAFAQPLSERVPGLSVSDADSALRRMFRKHRIVTRFYGQQLALQDDAYVRAVLAQALMAALTVDPEMAEAYITRAEEMCADYQVELDRIAGEVRAEIESTAYALPLDRRSPAATAILILAVFLLPGLSAARRTIPAIPRGLETAAADVHRVGRISSRWRPTRP